MSEASGLRVANVFHAGDGNLHPLVLYDRRIEGQEKAAEKLSERILELCIEMGGSITGEHGVGEEKKHMMGKMFTEPDLATMQRLRCAFDPLQLANPDQNFPAPPPMRRKARRICSRIHWKSLASRSDFEHVRIVEPQRPRRIRRRFCAHANEGGARR